jgi:hypothetical protein
VEHLLEVHFPFTKTAGESEEKVVTQISHLKFILKQVHPLTPAKQCEGCKVGQSNQGIRMHISEYYQAMKQNNSVLVPNYLELYQRYIEIRRTRKEHAFDWFLKNHKES